MISRDANVYSSSMTEIHNLLIPLFDTIHVYGDFEKRLHESICDTFVPRPTVNGTFLAYCNVSLLNELFIN